MIDRFRRLLCVGLIGALLSVSGFGYARQFVGKDKESPIRWARKSVPIGLSESLLKFGSREEVLELVRKSFAPWSKASGIDFRFRFVSTRSVSALGSVGDGMSVITVAKTPSNRSLFATKGQKNSAVTRLFYTRSGEIREADIALNPEARFSQDGESGTFDLQSTLTHEAGHLLGLDHSSIVGATMHRHLSQNGLFALPALSARSLSEDDRAGITAHYQTGAKTGGKIIGNLERKESFPANERHVWIEEPASGKVIAGAKVERNGDFEIAGLPSGRFILHVAYTSGDAISNEGQEVNIKKTAPTFVRIAAPDLGQFPFDAAVGFNSQLGNAAIPIASDSRYTLSLGGTDLYSRSVWIESSSSAVEFGEDSVHRRFTDGRRDVIGLELTTSKSLAPGDYSLRIYDSGVLIANLAGQLTVESLEK